MSSPRRRGSPAGNGAADTIKDFKQHRSSQNKSPSGGQKPEGGRRGVLGAGGTPCRPLLQPGMPGALRLRRGPAPRWHRSARADPAGSCLSRGPLRREGDPGEESEGPPGPAEGSLGSV